LKAEFALKFDDTDYWFYPDRTRKTFWFTSERNETGMRPGKRHGWASYLWLMLIILSNKLILTGRKNILMLQQQ